MANQAFKIVNAAAGAGKTFSLVKHYLLLLLKSNNPYAYQHILALTFTNKAVAEMKGRLLKTLWALAHEPEKAPEMCQALLEALPISQKQLQEKSLLILRKIFKDYGRFEVITLDKLTYSLVRTFAKDLKLPYQFEVVLQEEELLRHMLQRMMDEIGSNTELTQTLLGFSQFKMAHDKNWDVEKELFEMARSLLKENDRNAVEAVQQLEGETWFALKQQFSTQLKALEARLVEQAQHTLNEIEKHGLTPDDFYQKLLHKHFQKIVDKEFEGRFNNQLGLAIQGQKPLYKKSTPQSSIEKIEALRSFFEEQYETSYRLIGQWMLGQAILKQWIPMSLLRAMEQRLNALQQEEQKMLLGQFNTRISKVVQEQPVPFIYERLGAQYRHFFIDEFQDTSVLQWQNLVPLIGNALESETAAGEQGSLFLVGDPKQAIYRWRGGNNEQFLALLNKNTPFQLSPTVEVLSHNYRSLDELIHFNNRFFKTALKHLSSPALKTLYEDSAQQLPTDKKGGLVSVSFIPKKLKKEEAIPLYVEQTLDRIKKTRAAGYKHKDIALLVRTGDQAKALGNALLEEGIPFLSQETLFLAEAANVQFLIQLLQLCLTPQERRLKKGLLDYVWQYGCEQEISYHSFMETHLDLGTTSFFKALNQGFDSTFNFSDFKKYSLHEAVLYALSTFSFLKSQDAFMLYFLEHVFEYSQQYGGNIAAFLTHWERVSDTLKMAQPEGEDALQIMTIHKAKGLEFPVVILPFLDREMHSKLALSTWFPLNDSPFSELPWAYLPFSKKTQEYGLLGSAFYDWQRQAQEADALNVLYVALTRAKEQLHVVTKNTDSAIKTFALLFKEFATLEGHEVKDNSTFSWGASNHKAEKREAISVQNVLHMSNSLKWKEKLITPQIDRVPFGKSPQQRGLLLHRLMEKIDIATPEEIVAAEPQLQEPTLAEERGSYIRLLEQICQHPKLKNYYNTQASVHCEQEILVPTQPTLRPDRLVMHSDHTALIDYKTGAPKDEDIHQMNAYAEALENMGIIKIRKYLVYSQNELTVKELD